MTSSFARSKSPQSPLTTGLLLLLLTGCGAAAEREENDGDEAGEVGSVTETSGGDTSALGQALTGLFRDEIDFEIDDLAGPVPCTPIEDNKATVKSQVVAWPAALKHFIVPYLKSMPIAESFPDAIHGLYLVESAVLDEEVGGIACFRDSNQKAAIFVNARHVIEMREATGVGTYAVSEGVAHSYVLVEMRDLAVATIVHEALHAIDFKFYQFGTEEEAQQRETLLSLSWNTYDEPKDADKISIMALTDTAMAARRTYRGCPARGYASRNFGLTATSASEIAEELRYLAEDTNFIVPYTMANAIEDFAESLTVYHFLTTYQEGDRRRVYDQDLTQVPLNEATLLYDHDVVKIVEENPEQKAKLCQLAETVFGGTCKL